MKSTKHLVAAAIALAAPFVCAPFVAQAQSATAIRIGIVSAKQGVLAEPGVAAGNGAMLAAEQAGNRVLGRNLEVLWYDDANPQAAQQAITKLVDEDKAAAVVGGTNSASALAMAAVAKRAKVPLVVTAGAAREITGKDCNRYTFRTQLTVPVASRAITPLLFEKGKKWYFLTASYAFGQDISASMKTALDQAGGQAVGMDQVPQGTSDYSSFILKIRQAKPDVLVAGLGGNDLNNLMKQMAEYGLRGKVVLATPVVTDLAMWAIGPDAAAGVFAKQWQYNDPSNTDEEKRFVAAWKAKYDKPPAIEAWQGWVSMRMVLGAIEKARSTEGPAVVQSLETLRLPGAGQDMYYREWDHQFIHSLLVVKGRAPVGKDKWDMLEVVQKVNTSRADADALYGTKAEVGCTLGGL